MFNFTYWVKTTLFVAVLTLMSTQVFAQSPVQYEPNKLIIKISEEAEASLNRTLLVEEAVTEIPTLDALNYEHGITSMQQLIRTDPRFAERHRAYGIDRWFEITFSDTISPTQLAEIYKLNDSVEFAEPAFQYQLMGEPTSPPMTREEVVELLQSQTGEAPNDPRFDEQWHYHNTGQQNGTPGSDISLLEAWEIETGNSDIIVQVVDTGIDINHPDLTNMHWINPVPGPENGYDGDIHGWSHVTGNSNIQDTNGHGSHVAGTIAAQNNNGVGVSGIAGGDGSEDSGVRIMTSRVFTGSSGGSGFAEAVVYGADNGAVIANHSWGGGGFSQALRDAILYFIDNAGYDADGNPSGPIQGGLIIFAAGNNGSGSANQPIASNPEVLSIAATNNQDRKSWYSQHGSWVDMSAPGGETNTVLQRGVLSTVQNGNYQFYQGTSMAAPHAAGVAALVASQRAGEGISGDDIKLQLMLTSDDISDIETTFDLGIGRLNAFRALEEDDGVAPADIEDLVATETTRSSVMLEFTAPGGSGTSGVAFTYDVRFSDAPITEANFEDATAATSLPRPLAAGTNQQLTVTGLEHTTTYYFAIKTSDFFGNVSGISNTANATTDGVPVLVLSPTELNANATIDGGIITQRLRLDNTGNADLVYSFPGVAANGLLSQRPAQENRVMYDGIVLQRDEIDYRSGDPVLFGAGGPDIFGYKWVDSNESGGPTFSWIEISEIGVELESLSGTWDGNTQVQLPFDFPFYGAEYNSMRVSVNGWITFSSYSAAGWQNLEIPTSNDPNNLLAVFWDDLDMRNGGSVYTYYDEESSQFIVQWTAVPSSTHQGSAAGEMTFQAIISESGVITYQYLSMDGDIDTNTIGIENENGNDGLQVAFNTEYMEDELAIRFSTAPDWVSLSQTEGVVAAGETAFVDVYFDPNGLEEGIYTDELSLSVNELNRNSVSVPITLSLLDGPSSLIQVIHNAGNPVIKGVDFYLNNTLVAENLSYREASAFEWFNATGEVNFAIIQTGATLNEAETIYSTTLTIDEDQAYSIILNVDERNDTEFDVFVIDGMLSESTGLDIVTYRVFQGVPDAPVLDVFLRNGDEIAQNFEFGEWTEYLSMSNDTQIIDIFRAGTNTYYENFEQDFSMYEGETMLILMSGFRNNHPNPGLAKFNLIGVLPDGEVIMPRNATSSEDEANFDLPTDFTLNQNYPNPFNPTTQIQYAIPEASEVRLEVYNIQGQRVATLVNGAQNAGMHTVSFDASRLSSGMYIYRLTAGSFVQTRKMMLVK